MEHRRASRHPPIGRASALFLVAGVLFAALSAASMLGPVESIAFLLLGLATFTAIVMGLRRYRPDPMWPWLSITGALVLFLIAGAERTRLHTLGNLTATRSLLPDLIAIPGYLLLAAGLTSLARSNNRASRQGVDMILDGVVAALAVLTLAWVFMIDPVLFRADTPLSVRIVLACYPALSIYLVSIAFRIGFNPGAPRIPARYLLITSLVFMLAGDILYVFADLDMIKVAVSLLELPYLLAFVTFGACALEPSMADLSSPVPQATHVTEFQLRGRLAIVAVALVIPAFVSMSSRDRPFSDRFAVTVIVLALAITATWRIFRALKSSDRSQAAMAHLATHDGLTGLPNRALLEQRVNSWLRSAKEEEPNIALLFLDLDRFKFVNDTWGHSLGDELLIEVARRLRATVRADDLVARIGGDEFAIVLKETSVERATGMAERVRRSFREPFTVRQSETFVTASVGVSFAEWRYPMTDAESLIRDADNAMYVAKSCGRDDVAVFDKSMRDRVADRLALEQQLRVALEREELHLEYQPIIDMVSGRVVSLEALLRWTPASLAPVSPTLFIPIAEESGLIIEIGSWVISQACRQLKNWRTEVFGALDLRMSVNLSAMQLRDPNLMSTIRQALSENSLPSEALILELTESQLMDNLTASIEMLETIRTLGISLSIDDFGTGYSSLAYLKQLPVDFAKVDRSFVEGLDVEDSSDETLVAAIIAMAHALGVTVVAEGVETRTQDNRLIDLDCDQAQGFLYSRPTSIEGIPSVLRRLNGSGFHLVSGDAVAGRSTP